MSGNRVRRRGIVRGLVQGVGFRMSAREEASRSGLAGFARNLADGGVEVEVEGPGPAVAEFLEWLHTGPSWARVESVDIGVLEPTGEAGFHVE